MAAHRYWRAVSLEAYGTDGLELSRFHLLADGVRVDAPATLSASVAPDVSGALSGLQDTSFTTSAHWSSGAVKQLSLAWDFGGSPTNVNSIQLAGNNGVRFLLIARLEWSDDAISWVVMETYPGIAWPGVTAATAAASSFDPYFPNTVLLAQMNGVNGSTAFSDVTGKTLTAYNGAAISTSQSKFGGASGYFGGSNQYLAVPTSTDFDFGAGDFTVEAWIYLAGNSAKDAGGDRGCTIANTWDNSAPISGWLFAIAGNATTTGTGLSFDSWGPSTTRSSVSQSVSISQGVWHHVAAVVYGGVRSLYLDGTKYTPTMQYLNGGYDACNSQGKPLRVGTTGNTSYPLALNGYIDDFRVTKGVARYSANFTPPGAAPTSSSTVVLNTVKGRASYSPPVNAGSAPSMIFGVTVEQSPIFLGVDQGCVKDQLTGVLGAGIGRVKGTVKITPASPVHRKVRLLRERDSILLREQWSDPITGDFDFRFVDEAQSFTVITYDHLNNYRAVIADNLTLANGGVELMP